MRNIARKLELWVKCFYALMINFFSKRNGVLEFPLYSRMICTLKFVHIWDFGFCHYTHEIKMFMKREISLLTLGLSLYFYMHNHACLRLIACTFNKSNIFNHTVGLCAVI